MFDNSHFPLTRLRRLRASKQIRDLVSEVSLDIDKLILPLFIKHGTNIKNPISSMPGHFQLSLDHLAQEIQNLQTLGIKNIILFGIPEHKDPAGEDSLHEHGIIQQAIRLIKQLAPEMLVFSDICLCEYTSHGHCGVIETIAGEPTGVMVNNDQTIELLAKQAVSHAQAGADIIAPSANMDGMVQAIRNALDASNFQHLPILSYSVKYASAMYGPFRQAAEGAPQFGDRSTYQMDHRNHCEGIRECALDITEGADMLMVKPAHTYLDMIYRVKHEFPALPLGAYHTSGEFAMLKAAAANGWIDEKKAVMEVLTAIHRAGADFIFTYYAKEVATWI